MCVCCVVRLGHCVCMLCCEVGALCVYCVVRLGHCVCVCCVVRWGIVCVCIVSYLVQLRGTTVIDTPGTRSA